MTDTLDNPPQAHEPPEPTVVVRGVLGLGIADYASTKVAAALRHARVPIHRVRVTVSRSADPAIAEPLSAAAHVDGDRLSLHAHASGVTAHTAVDRLAHRLAHQVRTTARRERGHRGEAAPTQATSRGQVYAHTTYSPGPRALQEAIADMDALDHDFHLFTDLTGEDCLLRRRAGGYTLAGAHGEPPVPDPTSMVRRCDGGAVELTQSEARARLDLSGAPLLFFRDAADRRGKVLYRRVDGDYGLVQTAAAG